MGQKRTNLGTCVKCPLQEEEYRAHPRPWSIKWEWQRGKHETPVQHIKDTGSVPGSGRSPGKGNGIPLQCSFLENPMDRGAWWATVHGVQRVGHDLEYAR